MKKLVLLIPIIIILSPAIILLLLFLEEWIISILVLLSIVLLNNWSECFALSYFSKCKDERYNNTFSVLTYNLNRAYKNTTGKDDTDALSLFILKHNPDILLLQEYNPIIYPTLDNVLQKYYPYGIPFTEKERYKIVYSKFPIDNYKQLSLNDNETDITAGMENLRYLPICTMRIMINDVYLKVINCHLHSNNYSRAWNNFKNHRSIFRFVTSFVMDLNLGYAFRSDEAKRMCEEIENTNELMLICGDFNDIGGSEVVRIIKGNRLYDAWWQKGFGFGFTFKSLGLRLRLDHILYSKRIVLKEIKVLSATYSDHLPLLAVFGV